MTTKHIDMGFLCIAPIHLSDPGIVSKCVHIVKLFTPSDQNVILVFLAQALL